MNCTNCRYELSQCLDGRLPSGRRAIVMAHVDSCASCGEFWTELQAAQQLTQRLQSATVSNDFRDGLWERIHAGEGTPDNAFHESVSPWAKVRYTMSGAAAAAALLIGLSLLKQEGPQSTNSGSPKTSVVAKVDTPTIAANQLQPRRHLESPTAMQVADGNSSGWVNEPLPANRLSYELVAVETARQLEQRHSAVSTALRMLDNPELDRSSAIADALENAREFHALGELLLDMRDRGRLVFTDAEVDTDLRVAVRLLEQATPRNREDLLAVETFVAPALRSKRLGRVSQTIAMRPASNPHEELHALLRLNTQRPEIISKLFLVLGNDSQNAQAFPGTVFFMEDMCGPSWVAPRSEVESRGRRMRLMRQQFGDQNGRDVEIRIDVSPKKD